MKFPETEEVVELGACLLAESAPPMLLTTPVVEALPVVVTFILLQWTICRSSAVSTPAVTYAAPARAIEHVAPVPVRVGGPSLQSRTHS